MKLTNLVVVILAVASISGCGSSPKRYQHTGPVNIEILNDVDAGGWMTSFSNHFHVYKVKPDCSDIEHLGGYEMTGKKSAELSLPVNELLMVEMAFSKRVLQSAGSLERREAFIKLKKGESYKFDFYYRKTTIDLKLYKKGRKKDSEIPMIPWSEEACKKLI